MTTTILASFPSPSQGVWYLGPIPIRAYALFILAGVIVALLIGDRRWAERGGERGVIFDIALWAIIFGLIGGRLYHVLTDWTKYFGPDGAGFWAAFQIQEGGLGIWGAVAFGGVGAWIGCRRRGIPLPPFGDAIAPGIVLAQAIGRIGNYFNQELYGGPTTLPWGLEIYERRDANGAQDMLNGVSTGVPFLEHPVHPTFLYELLWNLLVFALLIWVDRRFRIGHGRLFALYVAAYCFGRFWIELMRTDEATLIAGIRINSFVSVFVFIGAVVYIMVAPKGREDPSELRGDAAVEVKAAPDVEESPVDELVMELAGVAATTGVVAAAKVAGEKEDEDAEAEAESEGGADDNAAEDEAAEEPDAAAAEEAAEEPDVEARAEVADEPEVEAVAEAEQLAEDVADAPAEDIAEADEFAKAGEAADAAEPEVDEQAEAVGGVGAVEGDEVIEAEGAAQEVHEAAVEGADEAAAVADEVAEEADAAEEPEVEEQAETEAVPAADEESEEESDSATDDFEEQAEAVGGAGAVEGDEVVEAEEAAPEVHEAAVEGDEEAAAAPPEEAVEEPQADQEQPATEEQADEQTAGAEPQPEAIGGVGAVEGDEVVEAEEAAPEVHEAAAAADEVAEAPTEETKEPADEPEPAQAKEPEEVAESGGGFRGWIRSRRNR